MAYCLGNETFSLGQSRACSSSIAREKVNYVAQMCQLHPPDGKFRGFQTDLFSFQGSKGVEIVEEKTKGSLDQILYSLLLVEFLFSSFSVSMS